MPRVILTREARKVCDFSNWIIGKMYEKKKNQEYLASVLGITQPAFSVKLKKGNFKHSETLMILKELEATDEDILRMMKV